MLQRHKVLSLRLLTDACRGRSYTTFTKQSEPMQSQAGRHTHTHPPAAVCGVTGSTTFRAYRSRDSCSLLSLESGSLSSQECASSGLAVSVKAVEQPLHPTSIPFFYFQDPAFISGIVEKDRKKLIEIKQTEKENLLLKQWDKRQCSGCSRCIVNQQKYKSGTLCPVLCVWSGSCYKNIKPGQRDGWA